MYIILTVIIKMGLLEYCFVESIDREPYVFYLVQNSVQYILKVKVNVKVK